MKRYKDAAGRKKGHSQAISIHGLLGHVPNYLLTQDEQPKAARADFAPQYLFQELAVKPDLALHVEEPPAPKVPVETPAPRVRVAKTRFRTYTFTH